MNVSRPGITYIHELESLEYPTEEPNSRPAPGSRRGHSVHRFSPLPISISIHMGERPAWYDNPHARPRFYLSAVSICNANNPNGTHSTHLLSQNLVLTSTHASCAVPPQLARRRWRPRNHPCKTRISPAPPSLFVSSPGRPASGYIHVRLAYLFDQLAA